MGSQQVLRIACLSALALVLGLGAAGAEPGEPPAAAPRLEPVVVVDLRPGDAAAREAVRDRFRAELAVIGGIEVRDGDGLGAALAGEVTGDAAAAAQALETAGAAYGALECKVAAEAAETAILAYAALRARGVDVTEPLRRAHVYELSCAHGALDRDRAARAAAHLRSLGATGDAPPSGIAADVWSAYPPVDATANVAQVRLTIETTPAGASVLVDHRPVGESPAEVVVAEGAHLVAVGTPVAGAARRVEASADQTISIALEAERSRWQSAGDRVRAWRAGDVTVDAVELGRLLDDVGVRFAFVLSGTRQVEVWALGRGEKGASRLAAGTLGDAMRLTAAILDRVQVWDGRAPDPAQPLLREDPLARAGEESDAPQAWWVYATLVGAVAVGAAIVIAADAADDHQRIELVWP